MHPGCSGPMAVAGHTPGARRPCGGSGRRSARVSIVPRWVVAVGRSDRRGPGTARGELSHSRRPPHLRGLPRSARQAVQIPALLRAHQHSSLADAPHRDLRTGPATAAMSRSSDAVRGRTCPPPSGPRFQSQLLVCLAAVCERRLGKGWVTESHRSAEGFLVRRCVRLYASPVPLRRAASRRRSIMPRSFSFRAAQRQRAAMGLCRCFPSRVSSYSVRGGTTAYRVRFTSPSRSRARRTWISIFFEMPGMLR